MRREKWEQQHPLRISFCFLNSLPALPQPHPLIFPSQFAFMSRALPPCNHITPPLPSMLHFHNASLGRSLHPIFPPFPPASSFPSSSFLPRCFSVLLSLCLPTLLGVRSLLSQPHSEAHPRHHKPAPNFDCLRLDLSLSFFLMCFVLTAFFIAATDGPFLPGVRVRTMRIGMRFLAAPCWPHDTPCQHSSISTSVAHLWCSVVRHRHPGTGMSPSFVTSGAVSCLVVSFIVLSLALPCDFKRTHALQATKVVKYSHGRRSAPSVIWLGRE